MNLFTRFFTKYFASSKPTAEDIEQELIRRESAIGRELFGQIPLGTRREFFYLNERTWVWHEESQGRVRITRYVINQKEVIKSVNGGEYERLSIEEAERLATAIHQYVRQVKDRVYTIPATA